VLRGIRVDGYSLRPGRVKDANSILSELVENFNMYSIECFELGETPKMTRLRLQLIALGLD
jgi:hypothetical protein